MFTPTTGLQRQLQSRTCKLSKFHAVIPVNSMKTSVVLKTCQAAGGSLSNNGAHRQSCRLTGHVDDKLKSYKCLQDHCLTSAPSIFFYFFFSWPALVGISRSAWKSHHRLQIHTRFEAITNRVLGKHSRSVSRTSRGSVRFRDKTDHLFPTAISAWVGSAVWLRCC